jgi:hypothetical protein
MDTNKLPKWAQEHIEKIERERDQAIKALNEYVDNQTVSPFYVEDYVSTGEERGPSYKRSYIQTHKMTIEHEGVELNVLLREGYIDLQWNGMKYHLDIVAFVPTSFQSAKLVSKENL